MLSQHFETFAGTGNMLPKNFLVMYVRGSGRFDVFGVIFVASWLDLLLDGAPFDLGGGQEGGRLRPGTLVLTVCKVSNFEKQ